MQPRHYQFFNFGRSNRLGIAPICSDEDYHLWTGWWLSGRICGRYVSYYWRFHTPRRF